MSMTALWLVLPVVANAALAEDPVPERAAAEAPPPLQARQRLNPTGRDIQLSGPLTDNGFIIGEVDYTITADERILVDSAAIDRIVMPLVSTESATRIRDVIAGRPAIDIAELAPVGLILNYDSSTLGLLLTLDPQLRTRQAISVSGPGQSLSSPPVAPADLSAYLTVQGNLDYVHRGFDRGLSNPNIVLDSAIRFGNFVLESDAVVDSSFSRQGTRLVYDDLKRTARYSAGDLLPITRGFSGATPMAGLSIARVYSDLDPQRNIQPRGQRSFTLTRAATVETYINGQQVQQTRLAPGNYDIGDFPLAQGSNNVQLLIRDDTGVERSVSFSIAFDRTLLAPGIAEFGLFAGVEAPFTANGRRYSDNPTASGFYRRGFSEDLTAGGNFQANQRGATAGAEVTFASKFGVIGVDLAGSSIDNIGQGYALNIGYERNFASGIYGSKSLVLSYQTQSRNFATPDVFLPANRFKHEIGATYAQSIGRDHFVSADAFYSIGRGVQRNQISFRLSHGWRATTRLLLTTEAIYEDRLRDTNYGVRFNVTYRFTRFSSGTAEVDTARDRQRLTYQTASGNGVGSYNASANVARTEDSTAFNAAVNTILNRGELGLAHTTATARGTNDIIDQRTSLRFGTSIAFADGHVALSRPIYDGFALVRPHESLKGADVYLSPTRRSYLGRSGALGPAVAAELSSYSPTIVSYDVPNAPVGYDIGVGALQFRSPYRAGHLVTVGSEYSVIYTARLVKTDGTPAALMAGKVYEIGAPDRAPVDMFTNRQGQFAAQGLRPGRWRLELGLAGTPTIYEFTVPEGANGLVREGELQPRTQQ